MLRKVYLPLLFVLSAALQAQNVRFHTNLGDIDVTLTPDVAPLTVANFLNYLNSGAYTNTIFHRSVSGFIIQGGGYTLGNPPVAITQNAAVQNEFNVSNTRGTIAMAKLGTDPNSATNQWFFNLADNSSNLDNQNGGFTVFGKISNNASLTVMDRIAALPVINNTSPFDQLPVYNYNGTLSTSNYVTVAYIAYLPTLTAAGFADAASYVPSATTGLAPGEIVTIFGTGLGPATLAPLQLDSNGNVANTLAGTTVTFDGVAAPVIYSSNTQLSVVAPMSLHGKTITQVVVNYSGIASATIKIPVFEVNPAIFTLNASGKGDGAIVRPDGSIVSSSSPAQVGDVLVLYGTGQGISSPALADGAIVGTKLPLPVAATTVVIDGQTVNPLYAGGAPSLVNGVLQVNFKVPQLAPGSHTIQLQVGTRLSPTGVTLQTK